MRLSDIMSHLQLAQYAEVGLVIFLATFLAIAVRVFFFTSRREHEAAAMIPLGTQTPASAGAQHDVQEAQR